MVQVNPSTILTDASIFPTASFFAKHELVRGLVGILYVVYSSWILTQYSKNRKWIDAFHIVDAILIVVSSAIRRKLIRKGVGEDYVSIISSIGEKVDNGRSANLLKIYVIRRNVRLLTLFLIMVVYGVPIMHYFALKYNVDFVSVGEMVAYNVCFSTMFDILQFLTIVFLIKRQFIMINGIIIRLSKEIGFNRKRDQLKLELRKVQDIHHVLSTICRKLNYGFSFQILYLLTETFLLSILVILYAIQEYCYNFPNSSKLFMGFLFIRLMFLFSQVGIMILVCSQTSSEAKHTGLLLSKQRMNKTIFQFYLQLIHHPIQFHACGFVLLNPSVLQSIVRSVILYVPLIVTVNLIATIYKNTK